MRAGKKHLSFWPSVAVSAATLLFWGCGDAGSSPAKPDATGSSPAVSEGQSRTPLQLLVVSDPELAAGIRKEWTARSETPLVVRQISEDELLTSLRHGDLSGESLDAVIYPASLLGTLVNAEQLSPVPDGLFERSGYAGDEVFPLIQGTTLRWGSRPFAVPLGMPVVMLAYRTDLLPAGTELPATWDRWCEMIRKWDTRATAQGSDPSAVRPLLQTLAPGHAALVFLARAAPAVRHRSQYSTFFDVESMRARIGNRAFVKTLEQMVADYQASGGDLMPSPEEAYDELVAGHAAMVIGRPPFRLHASESEPRLRRETLPETIRFASLPGSASMYNAAGDRWDARRAGESPQVPLLGVAGRVGSVLQSSRRKRPAWNLLLLLSGPQWSVDISSSSLDTAPLRRSQHDQARRWTGQGWSEATVDSWYGVLESSLTAHDWLSLPRIPGYRDYLHILDQAVREAVQGRRTPEDALSWTAGKWDEVTESIGKDSQKRAYRRSIGLDP